MGNSHNKKPRRSGIFYTRRLGLGRRADGANPGAGTAGHAGIRVDLKLRIALGDGGNGTLLCTGAALDALVADLICHV